MRRITVGFARTYDDRPRRFVGITVLLLVAAGLGVPMPSAAQESQYRVVVADGPPVSVTADSTQVEALVLASFHRAGRLLARVDSIDRAGRLVYVTPGPVLPVSRVSWTQSGEIPAEALRLQAAAERSISGRPWSDSTVSAAIRDVLEGYERLALPAAEVRIVSAALVDSPPSIALTLAVDPGRQPMLEGILLQGVRRTRPGTVARLLKLRVGATVSSFDAEAMEQALARSGLFDAVRRPVLISTGDSTAVIQVVATEAAPGSFDAALGYQSGSGGAQAGLVGTGRLELLSPFGAGRRIAMLLDRLPGQASRVEAGVTDPAVVGLPVGAEAVFRGLQQDSTYSRRSWRFGILFAVTSRLTLTSSWTSEVTRPGSAGVHEGPSRPAIARSDGSFFGVGLRLAGADDPVSPSRGAEGTVELERGWVTRTSGTQAGSRVRFERLSAVLRAYRPVGARGVLVAGLDGALLVAPSFDPADLLRLGGARTLRGYDEDRFRGRATGRGLVEGRYRLDRRSFAYLFAEAGAVDVPPSVGTVPGLSIWPGFGFGAQLETAAGLVLATYGFNPDEGPTRGRVHVRFSFGL